MGRHGNIVASTQLADVFENAFLPYPRARMTIRLGNKQDAHAGAGGARQNERHFSRPPRGRRPVDGQKDEAAP